jgi:Lon protease-like protein
MFPLSTVVFPHQRVPLHVFEPRYRRLVDDVRTGNGRFGICLIAKGSEVGGGDERVDVGTIVELQTVFPFSDGRCMVVVDGVERIKVDQWLADDPYPRAVVVLDPGVDSPSEFGLLEETESAVRSLRRLHSEMNPDSCVDVGCAMEDESCVRAWQLCALTPMATLDQLKLLREDRCDERLRLLGEICCERYGDLMRQLELDAPD